MTSDREQALDDLWHRSAGPYHEHVRRFGTHHQITALLAATFTTPPKSILDFGCGPGNSTRLLRRSFPDARLVGLDSAPAMVDIAERIADNAEDITYVRGRLDDLTSSAGLFDAIFCSNSFFHIEDQPAALARMRKSLAPAGRVVLSMYESVFTPKLGLKWPYASGAADDLMRRLLEGIRAEGFPVAVRKEDRHVHDEASLAQLFRCNGFQLRCAGALHLQRTPAERLSFFRIPAVAQEVFPDVPFPVVARVIDSIDFGAGWNSTVRTVFALVAAK